MKRSLSLLVTLIGGTAAHAQVSGSWSGQGGNWSDVSHWSSNPSYPSAGGTASFGSLGGGDVNNDLAALDLSGIVFAGPLSTSLRGNDIHFGNTINIDSRNAELWFDSPLDNAVPQITASMYGTNFVKTGAGTVYLKEFNDINGRFAINEGRVQFYGSNVFGNIGSITLGGGTLQAGIGEGAYQGALSTAINLAANTHSYISGYGIYSNSILGSGSVTFAGVSAAASGNNTYTGATEIIGGGTNGVTLGGGGRFASTPSIDISGRLLLDNTATPNTNRINDTAAISLRSGTLQLSGNGTTSLNETVGNITLVSGSNTLAVVNNGTNTTLTAGNLIRQNRATLDVRGIYDTGNVGTLTIANGSSILFGGGGLAGTTTMSVIPFAADVGITVAPRILTVENGVVRPLDPFIEMARTFTGATAATNLSVGTNSRTLNSAATVNSVFISSLYLLTGSGTLGVNSGLIVGGGAITTAVDFGSHEGTIFETQISGIISGSNGVTYDQGSTLGGFRPNAANVYSGPTQINSGIVTLAGDVRPSIAGPFGIDNSAIVLGGGAKQAGLSGAFTNYRDVSINLPLGTREEAAPQLLGNVVQAGNVALNGALSLQGSAAVTGNIIGAGRLFVSNDSATLAGQNSYSGGTKLSFGTLTLGSNSGLGSGSLLITGLTTLNANGARSLPNAVYMSSGGSLVFGGSALSLGTLNLGNALSGLLVNNGTTTFAGMVNGQVRKMGSGELRTGAVDLASLEIQSGTVSILSNSGLSRIGLLSMSSETHLNLNNNDLMEDYTGRTYTTVDSIRTAIHDGVITYAPSATRQLGYADNAVLKSTTFDSLNISLSTLLLKYTFTGDTNLDGQVDIIDLGNLAGNWHQSAYWTGGDFNYDGQVDIVDLGALAGNWHAGTSGSISFQEALLEVGLGGNTVPEPAMALLLPTLALLRRRR